MGSAKWVLHIQNPRPIIIQLGIVCHSESGIYPDLLHILDLAIYTDAIASAFLEWTDFSGSPFPGRSRDERLLKFYGDYLGWSLQNRRFIWLATCLFINDIMMYSRHSGCDKLLFLEAFRMLMVPVLGNLFWRCRFWHCASTSGVPNSCRARAFLFQSGSIQSKASKYPSIGQKNSAVLAPEWWSIFVLSNLQKSMTCTLPNQTGLGWAKFLENLGKHVWKRTGPHTTRWIQLVFEAFVTITDVFAELPPGWLPSSQVRKVEAAYLKYREAYNSFWVCTASSAELCS